MLKVTIRWRTASSVRLVTEGSVVFRFRRFNAIPQWRPARERMGR